MDRPDNGQDEEYAGPCIACGHPAPEHDEEAECWVEDCECGTGEPGDPMLTSGRAGAGEQQREQIAELVDQAASGHRTTDQVTDALLALLDRTQPDDDPGPQCPSTSHDTDGGWRCERRAGHDPKVKHRNGEVEW